VRFFLLGFAFVIVAVAATGAHATTFEYFVCSGNNGSGNTCTVPYGQSGTWFATGVEACQANDPRSAGYPGDIVAPYWNDAYPTLGICIYDPDPVGDPITWGLATHYTINCTDPQVIDLENHGCKDPSPCPSTGSFTVSNGINEFPSTYCQTGIGDGGENCAASGSGPALQGNNGLWSKLYTYNGQTCNGTDPTPTPAPEPIPPITPTDPADDPDPIPTPDPGTENDPATHGDQHTLSDQLGGLSGQLRNLEGGTSGLQQGQNQGNSLLSQILDELKNGTGGGGSGGTDPTDQDGDGTSDSFGDGGCTGPPSCNGPAIECAIAAQAYYVKCNTQVEEPTDLEADVAANIAPGVPTPEDYFDDTAVGNIIDVDTYFDPPLLNSGSCPADYYATVFGQVITFSWGYVCEFLGYVRPVMLAIAWLISGFIFYRGMVRDF